MDFLKLTSLWIILPVVLYGCETCSLTLREECRLGPILLSFGSKYLLRILISNTLNLRSSQCKIPYFTIIQHKGKFYITNIIHASIPSAFHCHSFSQIYIYSYSIVILFTIRKKTGWRTQLSKSYVWFQAIWIVSVIAQSRLRYPQNASAIIQPLPGDSEPTVIGKMTFVDL